ncbi:putative glycoside hydrolase [Oxobacter pfennigii]|nr:putative glycoside hydrolase [Oxobacter pfennigii]
MQRNKRFAIIAVILVLIAAAGVFIYKGSWVFKSSPKVADEEPAKSQDPQPTEEPEIEQPLPTPIEPEPKVPEHKEVRGIYLTGHSVGLESRFSHLIDLINTTELNAMVIDVKDDNGEISYKSSVPLVKELETDKTVKIKDIKAVIQRLDENYIYPIARIVVFKDNIAATQKPEFAIKSKDGSVWRDYKKVAWINPYIKEAWEYPISIAEEAADMGFKEIQFDYVRFPTDGNRSLIDYGEAGTDRTMSQSISEFLSYARERLSKKGVVVSADIYGLVTTVKDDMGIGQQLEDLSTSVDVLCPMVYPSHYAYGSYGIKYPDLEPYRTVFTSLSTAKQRVEQIQTDKSKAKIRPWLQDFTGAWLRPKSAYKVYKSADVKAQIQAAYDSGLTEWILWNAGNKYTEDALLKE